MGVNRTDYLMFGIDIGKNFEPFANDDLLPEIEGRPDRRFDLIYDGMRGEYCIAGKIIAKSDPTESHERNIVYLNDLAIDRWSLAGNITQALNRQIEPDDIRLILFSHFS